MLEIQEQIETHLNAILGRVGLESFWRKELSDHLLESYEHCLEEASSPEEAWEATLRRSGDLLSVANELMDLHNPSAIEWMLRTLGVGLGILIVFWLTGIRVLVFFDLTAALFVFVPAGSGLFFMKRRESMSILSILGSHRVDWTVLRPYLRAGSIAGVAVGTALALGRIEDLSTLGPPLALAFISGLYGLILTTFSWPLLVGLTTGMALDWAILFAAFGWESWNNLTLPTGVFLYPAIAVFLTLVAAWFYYGRNEWFHRFQQFPLIATIVTSMLVLMNLDGSINLAVLSLAAISPVLILYPLQGFARVWKAHGSMSSMLGWVVRAL